MELSQCLHLERRLRHLESTFSEQTRAPIKNEDATRVWETEKHKLECQQLKGTITQLQFKHDRASKEAEELQDELSQLKKELRSIKLRMDEGMIRRVYEMPFSRLLLNIASILLRGKSEISDGNKWKQFASTMVLLSMVIFQYSVLLLAHPPVHDSIHEFVSNSGNWPSSFRLSASWAKAILFHLACYVITTVVANRPRTLRWRNRSFQRISSVVVIFPLCFTILHGIWTGMSMVFHNIVQEYLSKMKHIIDPLGQVFSLTLTAQYGPDTLQNFLQCVWKVAFSLLLSHWLSASDLTPSYSTGILPQLSLRNQSTILWRTRVLRICTVAVVALELLRMLPYIVVQSNSTNPKTHFANEGLQIDSFSFKIALISSIGIQVALLCLWVLNSIDSLLLSARVFSTSLKLLENSGEDDRFRADDEVDLEVEDVLFKRHGRNREIISSLTRRQLSSIQSSTLPLSYILAFEAHNSYLEFSGQLYSLVKFLVILMFTSVVSSTALWTYPAYLLLLTLL